MLNDPDLQKKIEEAASKNAPPQEKGTMMEEDAAMMNAAKDKPVVKASVRGNKTRVQTATGSNTMLAQVVGVILGSPEFQRK